MTALIIIGAICLLNLSLFAYLYIRVQKSEKWKAVEKPKEHDNFINFS